MLRSGAFAAGAQVVVSPIALIALSLLGAPQFAQAQIAQAQIAQAQIALAQAAVPVRELSAVDAKTSERFGNIFNLRQLAGGKVLVNDGLRRQLVVLDGNLSHPTVLVDSVTEGGQSYGPRASPLIPYLADSSLFVDGQSSSLLVIDPNGKIAHVMSAPKAGDLRFLAGGTSGIDAQGNLLYRAANMIVRNGPLSGGAGAPTAPIQPSDSASIVRANFETRVVDTVGRVKISSPSRLNMVQDGNGKPTVRMTINPLVTVDEWAVLSDGTIAMVRGHDYHVDLIHPDGTLTSTPKLPFDWKRLTDADKQALIDSAQAAQDKQAADAKANAANPNAPKVGGGGDGTGQVEMKMIISTGSAMGSGGGGGGGMSISPGGPGGPPGMQSFNTTPTIEFVPLKDIADYYPAIRQGAAKADLDGNLWILPTTSAQSKAGELVYDVMNNKGELFQRVRLPIGRSIAGFGHSGVVYLMYRDGTAGWALERTKILNNARATD